MCVQIQGVGVATSCNWSFIRQPCMCLSSLKLRRRFETKVSPTYLPVCASARKHKLLRAQSLEIANGLQSTKTSLKLLTGFPPLCHAVSNGKQGRGVGMSIIWVVSALYMQGCSTSFQHIYTYALLLLHCCLFTIPKHIQYLVGDRSLLHLYCDHSHEHQLHCECNQ